MTTKKRVLLLIIIYLGLTSIAFIAAYRFNLSQAIVQQFVWPWVIFPARAISVMGYFFVAFLTYRLSWRIAGALLYSPTLQKLFISSSNYLAKELTTDEYSIMTLRPRQSAQYLVSSGINLIAFSVATFLSLTTFFSPETVAVVTGLVTAGFGFGARTMIGDLLSGAGNIFEDNFDVRDKVEIIHTSCRIEGSIESISLRTMTIRAETGELYVIPNGEIRILRNFTRGRFSSATVKFKVQTTNLQETLSILNELNEQSVELLPHLLEPWMVISEEGVFGANTELTLVCRAQYKYGAALRLSLLTFIEKRFKQSGIELID